MSLTSESLHFRWKGKLKGQRRQQTIQGVTTKGLDPTVSIRSAAGI